MTRRTLEGVHFVPNWTSIIGALEGALQALGERYSTAYLMGATGHAFRLNIVDTPEGLAGPSGPFAIDFEQALALYRSATGYRFERRHFDRTAGDFDRRVEETRKRIMRSIDMRIPVIAFDLFLAEYGLIFGYDDHERVWQADTMMTPQVGQVLPWSRWPTTDPERYDIVLIGKQGGPSATAVRDALAFAVTYAEQGEPTAGVEGPAQQGLAAYERWIRAFEGEEMVHPFGNAYNAQVVQAARGHAARFLAEIAEQYPAATGSLKAAAHSYRQVTLALSRLTTLFPYPQGGEPGHPAVRAEAVRYLRLALEHEREAIAHLKESLPAL